MTDLAPLTRAAAGALGHARRPRPGERAAGDDRAARWSRARSRAGSSGDVEAGLRVGVLFELFALDVLPVGAVRYPDYGPATVAATALAAGAPWQLAPRAQRGARTGRSRCSAGWSLQLVRRCNARAIQRRAAALAAGESGAIRRLQYAGAAARCRPGRGAHRARPRRRVGARRAGAALDRATAVGLTLVAIGCGLSAAVGGAVRSAGRGARLRWLAAGRAWSDFSLAVLR